MIASAPSTPRSAGLPGRIAGAVGIGLTSGLIAALLMPRGPVTAAQAIVLLILSLATGLAAGAVLRSRWAMLLAPVVHLAAFELGRLGASGPTVDGIHLDSTYGVLGFIVGRGAYVLLIVPPMLLGVAWGNGLAATGNRTGIGRRHSLGHRVRQGISLLTAAALIVLGVWIALPARVPPVVDAQGHAIPGSVADIGAVSLGGNQQWIQARGANPANPVILYIPGGPGQSDFAQSRALLQPLEDDFTVVTWDQRGNGRSYASFDPSGITLDAAVSDLVALANHLRERFDEEKIYLLGESWGTIPAVLAAQRHPGLFHALIGSGQMVDVAATDRLIYDDLLVWADAHDPGLAARLRGFGPPPYRDLWSYSVFLENYPHLAGAYNPPQAYLDRHAASGAGFFGIMGTEYPPVDKLNVLRGLMDTFDVLYPQLQDLDFRREVTSLEVPIYLFEGAHELRGRREPLDEWYQRLHAPTKGVFRFETGGHAVAFEHADDLDRILSEIIVPATYRR
ncbi:MAG: alpha/beta fold hydrolase [Propionicimonas sp.]